MRSKLYNHLAISILLIFTSTLVFGQTSDYKYVQNFETFPSDWGIFKRNSPGPQSWLAPDFSWLKEGAYGLGDANSGSANSYMFCGINDDVNDGDHISQWLYTKPFLIANGDYITFYTKNLNGTGADRLQVWLSKVPYPQVNQGYTEEGDFEILLEEINPTNADNYPDDWTKYSITISGLAEGEVVNGCFGFRYFIPTVGCVQCPLPTDKYGLSGDESAIATEVEGLVLGEIASALFDGKQGSGGEVVMLYYNLGSALIEGIIEASNSSKATKIGLDEFVYNPTDIRIESDNGEYFVHSSNPTFSGANFTRYLCMYAEQSGVDPNDDFDESINDNVIDFKIHNYGTAFQILSKTITGANASDFEFKWGAADGSTIPANNHYNTFGIRFKTNTPGPKEAIVTLNTNHPMYPQIKFKITGTTNGQIGAPILDCNRIYNGVYFDAFIDLKANGTKTLGPDLGNFVSTTGGVMPANLVWVDESNYCGLQQYVEWSIPGGKTYTCADAGTNDSFTIRATDSRDQSFSECVTTVTVRDVTKPNITSGATLPEQTYYLHADSAVFYKSQLTVPTVSYTDDCGPLVALLPYWGDTIGGHGTYNLTWRFADQTGNMSTKYFYQKIHVIDNTPPVALCQNLNIGFGGTKAEVYASAVNDSSYDVSSRNLLVSLWNDAIAVPEYGVTNDSRLVDKLEFDCSNAGSTVAVKLVVKDLKSNQLATCVSNVSFPAPGEVTCKDAHVYLGGHPSATLYYQDVLIGTGDCAPNSITLSQSSFDCSDIGFNNITVTAVAANGQTTVCNSNVRVHDFPSYNPENYYNDSVITIYMDDSYWPHVGYEFYRPYALACGTTYWDYTITGATNIQRNNVTTMNGVENFYPGTSVLTKTMVHPTELNIYGAPLKTTIKTTIHVVDTLKPMIHWNQGTMTSFYKIDSCKAETVISCPYVPFASTTNSIWAQKADGYWGYIMTGATVKTVTDLLLGPDPFTIENLNEGVTNVKYFATDASGNKADTVYLAITTERPYPTNYPVRECPQIVIPAEHAEPFTFNVIDNIKTPCTEIDSSHRWEFTVTDPGKYQTYYSYSGLYDEQTVQITLQGAKYNPSNTQAGMYRINMTHSPFINNPNCTVWVDLRDKTAPSIQCPDDATYQLDQGICDMPINIDMPLLIENAQNSWYYTISGDANYSSPVMNYTITSDSTPNLGVGEYILTMYGKDFHGNISSCTSNFTIEDVIAPYVLCPNNQAVTRSAGLCEAQIGTCSVWVNFVGDYAPDRIEEFSINSYGTINYSNVPNSITFNDGTNGTGANGLNLAKFRAACEGTFSFDWNYTPNSTNNSYYKNQPIISIAGQPFQLLTGFDETLDYSIYTSQNGHVSITVSKGDVILIGLREANDGSVGASLTMSNLFAPTFQPSIQVAQTNEACKYTYTSDLQISYLPGVHDVTYEITDEYGNTTTCNQQITVLDNEAVNAVCQDVTLYLNSAGKVSTTPENLLTSCLSETNTLSLDTFNCSNIGNITVTATSTNSLSQSSGCNSVVTIVDTVKPFLTYNVLNFTINPAITDTLKEADMIVMADDNCSVQSITASKTTFDCTEIGRNEVDFIVIDGSGNRDTIAGWVNVIPDGFSVSNELGVQELCSGDTAFFAIGATNVATYQWQQEKEYLEWAPWDTTLPLEGQYPSTAQHTMLQTPNGYRKSIMLGENNNFFLAYHIGNNVRVQKGYYYGGGYVWEQWPYSGAGHQGLCFNGTTEIVDTVPSSLFDMALFGGHVVLAGSQGAQTDNGQQYFVYVKMPDQNGYPAATYPLNLNTYSGDWVTNHLKLATSSANDVYLATTRFNLTGNSPYKPDKLTVQKLPYGGSWQIVGNEEFGPYTKVFDMTTEPSTRLPVIALIANGGGELSVMKPVASGDSLLWQYLGNKAFANAVGSNRELKIVYHKNVPYVAFLDSDNGNKMTLKKLVGSAWQTVGTPGFSTQVGNDVSLMFQDDMPYVSYSYKDGATQAIQTYVYRFLNGAWESFGPVYDAFNTNSYNTRAFSSIHKMGEDIILYTQDSTMGKVRKLELWDSIVGATTDTLKIPNITTAMNGKRVRCQYGTGCADRYSDPGYIYVDSLPEVWSIAGPNRSGIDWQFSDPKMITAGEAEITALPKIGGIEWYAQDGVTSLGNGELFQATLMDSVTYQSYQKPAYKLKPLVDSTTTFYAQAIEGRCRSAKAPIVVKVVFRDHTPYVDNDTICKGESTVLHMSGSQPDVKYQIYTDDINNNDSLVFWYISDQWERSINLNNLQETKDIRIKGKEYHRDAVSLMYNGDYIDYGDISSIQNFPTSAITIEAYIHKPSSGNGFPYLSYSNIGDGNLSGYAWVWDNGTFRVNKAGVEYNIAWPTLPVGYTHVVTVASNSAMKIYYDGVLVASHTNITNDPINQPSNPTFVIGKDGRFGSNSNIGFDNLRIWTDDVYQFYHNINTFKTRCLDGTETNLAFNCTFDNITGNTIYSEKGSNGTHYGANSPLVELGQATCLTTDSVWLDTVNVFVKNIDGLTNYVDYFNGCAGTPIEMNLASGIDSIIWFDSVNVEFPIPINYGDTFSITLGAEEEAYFYISNNPECMYKEVYAYGNLRPGVVYATGDSICTGSLLDDASFNVTTTQTYYGGSFSTRWYADITGDSLIYGEFYVDSISDYIYGSGGDFSITENDTLWVEAYEDGGVCPPSTRVPAVANIVLPPQIISTQGAERCGEGTLNLQATAENADYVEWWDDYNLIGYGEIITTPSISVTTNYYPWPYNNACGYPNSVPMVVATIHSIDPIRDTIVACDSYHWEGTTYTASGDYSATLVSSFGCDSTRTLHLTINQSTIGDTTATACTEYTWHGATYTASGNYNDTLVNAIGCDSVLTLHLTINNVTTGDTTATSCYSYNWHGNTYNTSGNYKDTITNILGCDSIVTLHLTIGNDNTGGDSVNVCTAYFWAATSVNYSTNGTYTALIPNVYGCDSLASITLTVGGIATGDTSAAICYGPFNWYGTDYTVSGDYNHTLTAAGACDSVVTLHLNIKQGTTGTAVLTACNSYTWTDGITYTTSNNTAKDTVIGNNGCDSIVTLNLTILNSYKDTAVIAACESYNWQGNTYTASGIYNDSLTMASGCDSILTLDLTINHATTGDTTATSCTIFNWYGINYYLSGNYPHTLTSAVGCDSVVTLHLTINKKTKSDTITTACYSFDWHGNSYTISGNYPDTLINAAGCDSIVTLYLTINDTTYGDTTAYVCSDFMWHGITYTTSGDYMDTVASNAGCDSIVTLHLFINSPNAGDTTATACNSFDWYGTNYTTNGDFTHILTNAGGCDSTVTLHLTINSANSGGATINACTGYYWNATSTGYTSSGTYTALLSNVYGCDSLATLTLTVGGTVTGDTSATVCNGPYSWYGSSYTVSGDYNHTLTANGGCDSIMTLHLTVNQSTTGTDTQTACDSYTWIDGNTYTTSNSTATHTVTGNNGCDSTVTLNLTILNSYTNTQSVVTCGSYTWQGSTYTSTGVYADSLTMTSGCDSVLVLNLTITSSPSITVSTVQPISCNGGIDGQATANVVGGTAPYTFNWSSGETTQTAVGLTNNVSVTLTDVNGCVNTTSATISEPMVLSLSTSSTNAICNGAANGSAPSIVSGGITPYVYNWSDGQTTSDASNLVAGAYTLSLTDANGCAQTATVTITEPTSMVLSTSGVNANCGNADGSVSVVATGGTSPYNYNWADGSTSAADANVTSGSHGITVTDAAGCTSNTIVLIADNDGPAVTLVSKADANCGGNDGHISINPTGGTLPYSYLWSNGVSTQNVFNAPAGENSVVVTDNSGCVGTLVATIATNGTFPPSIAGHVTTKLSGFNLTSGKVSILTPNPSDGEFIKIGETTIDSNGDYLFAEVTPIGKYTLLIEPDTTIPAFRYTIPTYNGSTYKWNEALILNAVCDSNYTTDIVVIELEPLNGSTNLSGFVVNDGSNRRYGLRAGDPVPGVDISLEQIPGGILAFTSTDSTGYYEFKNVPNSDSIYTIYVDIPGLTMINSYMIDLSDRTAADTSITELNFFVSDSTIYRTTTTSTNIGGTEYAFVIDAYPNPSLGDINFVITGSDEFRKFEFQLIDVNGRSIRRFNTNKKFTLNRNELSSGLYFYQIKLEGTIIGRGKVVFD